VLPEPTAVGDRFGIISKKPRVSPLAGVMGDELIEEASVVAPGEVKKSESRVELIEEPDEADDDVEMLRMSGAVKA